MLSVCHKFRVDHLHLIMNLSDRNRPISIKNGMLTKLTAVSPDPANNIQVRVLKFANEHFPMSSFVPVRNTLVMMGYDSIGVHQQIRKRDFTTQISMTLNSIAS